MAVERESRWYFQDGRCGALEKLRTENQQWHNAAGGNGQHTLDQLHSLSIMPQLFQRSETHPVDDLGFTQ
jgi:hypothetical protein